MQETISDLGAGVLATRASSEGVDIAHEKGLTALGSVFHVYCLMSSVWC